MIGRCHARPNLSHHNVREATSTAPKHSQLGAAVDGQGTTKPSLPSTASDARKSQGGSPDRGRFRYTMTGDSGSGRPQSAWSTICYYEPLARLERASTRASAKGLLAAFADALVFVVDSIVADIVGEQNAISEYVTIGRNAEREPLERLAAYLSAWSTEVLLSHYPQMVHGRGAPTETGTQLMADPVVTDLIRRMHEQTHGEHANLPPLPETVDSLLGLPASESFTRTWTRRKACLTVSLSSVPTFFRDCVGSNLAAWCQL
jgi:hypothetical protein